MFLSRNKNMWIPLLSVAMSYFLLDLVDNTVWTKKVLIPVIKMRSTLGNKWKIKSTYVDKSTNRGELFFECINALKGRLVLTGYDT